MRYQCEVIRITKMKDIDNTKYWQKMWRSWGIPTPSTSTSGVFLAISNKVSRLFDQAVPLQVGYSKLMVCIYIQNVRVL